jgi:hypothetical protein
MPSVCFSVSQLLATLRGPGKLRILFRAIVFLQWKRVSGTRAGSRIAYQPPQGAQRCIDKRRTRKNTIGREEYIDTWREGVHDLLTQIVAIFLK